MIGLTLPVLLASCWRTGEDSSFCTTEDNLVLRFSLERGATRKATFTELVGSVDVFLYDAAQNIVTSKRLDIEALEAFCGATFTVAPGLYHVVCWGNVDEHSRIDAVHAGAAMPDGSIELTSSGRGSRLYYAPFKTQPVLVPDHADHAVEVLASEVTEANMVFAKAHRTVEVFVRNHTEVPDLEGLLPVAEQRHACGRFDFLLCSDPEPFTLTQQTTPTMMTLVGGTPEQFTTAAFHSMLVPVHEQMVIALEHPITGSELASVDLKQYIEENHIEDDSHVQILFTFDLSGARVGISMPEWNSHTIIPEL